MEKASEEEGISSHVAYPSNTPSYSNLFWKFDLLENKSSAARRRFLRRNLRLFLRRFLRRAYVVFCAKF